jgi:mannose/fructose/N-acetylgalactosamine-specific phosphotransferase system component IIB
MSIVLFRVDERLIHGQVVVGWGAQLRPNRIIVVDDALADSVWEQELYTLGLPEELETHFETVRHARAQLPAWRTDSTRAFVLTRDVATMRRLAEGGLLRGEEVNLGGIHHSAGRRSVLPYLYLSADEADQLNALAEQGVLVSARDVPNSRKVDLSDLLKNSGSH